MQELKLFKQLTNFFSYVRNNEEWSRVRKAMASKLLRPQDVGENIQSFCSMTRDAVSYLAKTRGDAGFDNEIPNLEDVLYNFSAESKYIYQW